MFSCINRTGVKAAALMALLLPWCVSCGDDAASTASAGSEGSDSGTVSLGLTMRATTTTDND